MRLLIFLLIFIVNICYTQKSYPYLFQDSTGGQFVILTLEQAQKLDNATEFSPILWKNHTSYFELVDSLCEKKLQGKNLQIETLKSNIDTLKFWSISYMKSTEVCKEKLQVTENKIDVLNEINTSLKSKVSSLETHISDKDKELKKSKKETTFAIIGGFVGSLIIFLFSL